ncbi:glycerophosphodiester phosphodiesterase [Dictyobacter arantiisoli]|uniref:Glycerophosphoryl diester phosphodiesterase n=1 Tax=Dictyobacter arantiisoli TaxID=2014874 RepID=A0A5A5T9N9_9CHLR|nr:glycerophosphodiester phosphodiesterase family protein [Dictyobacter arantiisoli]GCF07866.1 glycerophosphoryl diester phosphodiesterase [Dictyobacter arantiisoli]
MAQSKRSLVRIAHRGGSLLAPENTLAAFRNALTMPVDMLELDVQMSRDGQVVVFHDATVERVTNGTGNLLDLDFAYLRSLDAASHFPGGWPLPEQIPTLREVLALAHNRVQVCIELKLSERDGVYGRYPRIAEAIVEDLRATKMVDQVLLISFDWVALAKISRLENSLVTGALVSRDLWTFEEDPTLEKLCKQVSLAGCNWIDLDRELFTPELLSTVHRNGFKLGLWTVDDLAELRSFASVGVDALTTDRPDLFAQI